jgi:RNA polymerase sigma-70 factor (ECF subfamily)
MRISDFGFRISDFLRISAFGASGFGVARPAFWVGLGGKLCDVAQEAVNSDASRPAGQFSTTRWSVVLLAGQEGSPESAAALEKLCRAYWQPIFAFARRKGASEEDAKDLTQQFFALLLERKDFSGLDPRKGKFRTFLLAAFAHFLANEHDRASALKRGGGQRTFSLDEVQPEELDAISRAEEFSPGTIYDLGWAKAILKAALRQLKEEMSRADNPGQFDQLKQFLTSDADSGHYAVTAEKLGVQVSSVPVLVHRLRQRYRELVRQEVAQTVSSPTELEEEMRHLFALLNR